jgi:hypothetical protein
MNENQNFAMLLRHSMVVEQASSFNKESSDAVEEGPGSSQSGVSLL